MSLWKLDLLVGEIAATKKSSECDFIDPEHMERLLNEFIDRARDLHPSRPQKGYNP